MRILYLTINESIKDSVGGVSNKLLNKVSAFKEKVDFCVLLNARVSVLHNEFKLHSSSELFNDVEFGVMSANVGYFKKQATDRLFYNNLIEYIKIQNYKADRIIIRYPYASKGLLNFVTNFKNQVVFEHNTKELEELKLQIDRKKYASFSLRPSAFNFWFQEKKLPIIYEKYLSKKIFEMSHSGACVTSEIAKHENQKNKHYKTFVSSNFYNVKETQLLERTYDPETELLTFGMIVTTTAPWYGLERLLKSFAQFQTSFKLILAGIEKDNKLLNELTDEFKIKSNLELIGKIKKEELPKYYSKVHVSFGSLGLHHIQLNYASTLKVKESVSFGIPVVIGYFEEDFYKNEIFTPYYHQIPNNDTLIDFNELKKFALNFYANPQSQFNLRKSALQFLDVDVKVGEFLKNISS